MRFELSEQATRQEVFGIVAEYLASQNLSVDAKDLERLWGGFFAISEEQTNLFVGLFFPELRVESLRGKGRLSPKVLMVEPRKKLSWQYHHRRAEIWKSIYRGVGVVSSLTDVEGGLRNLREEESIELAQGQRHRLVGLETWGVVAEIWLHTDPSHPSDEEDIVRLEDEFGR